jgi:hypothetical protein
MSNTQTTDRCHNCGHDLFAHAKHTKEQYHKGEMIAILESLDCAICDCKIKI